MGNFKGCEGIVQRYYRPHLEAARDYLSEAEPHKMPAD